MGNNTYYDKRTGKWAPSSYKQRRINSKKVEAYTDYLERQKNKNKPEQGVRGKFLEAYKTKGYVAAKQLINAKFEREVFTDEILKKWIEEASKEANQKNMGENDDAR